MKFKLRKFVIRDDLSGHYIPEKMPGKIDTQATSVEPIELSAGEPRLFDTPFACRSFIKQWRRGKKVQGEMREIPHRLKRQLSTMPVIVTYQIEEAAEETDHG